MLVSHKRKNVFRKESHQQACDRGFRKLEQHGFRFGSIGFGGTHVHLAAGVPKRYSVAQAEIMRKRFSAMQIFEEKPNSLKLYPDRHFWPGTSITSRSAGTGMPRIPTSRIRERITASQ